MHIVATHLVTVKGTFDKNIWSENTLLGYINKKIKNNIFSTFHTSSDWVKINKNNVDVSVYISCYPSEVNKKIVLEWVKDNITEAGLKVTWFGIEEINSKVDRNKMSKFSVLLD